MTTPRLSSSIPAARRGTPRPNGDVDVLGWLARYWLEPVALHGMAPKDTGTTLAPLGIDEEQRLRAELREYLDESERALALVGFDTPFRALNGGVRNVASVVSLLEHPGHHVLAFVMVSTGQHTGMHATVTFHNAFVDGVELWTSNSRQRMRTPRQSHRRGVRFASLENPRALYDIHRFRIEERARAVPVAPLSRGSNPLAYQTREAEQTFEFWVGRGLYRRDGNRLRITWRGAFSAAWRGLFPWAQITDALERRETDAVLARYRAVRGSRSQV